jgi:WD40 repeat protein
MSSKLPNATYLFLFVTILLCCLLGSATDRGTRPRPRPQPDMVVRTGNAGLIQALAFSPRGNFLASWSADGNMIVWNADSLQEYTRFKPDSPTGLPHFELNDRKLLISDRAGIAEYTLARRPTKRLVLSGAVLDFVTSRNGLWLAHTDEDRAVRLFNLSSGRDIVVEVPRENESYGVRMAFSPDSRQLAVLRPNGLFGVYAIADNGKVQTVCAQLLKNTGDTIGFDPSGQLWIFDAGLTAHAEISTKFRYAKVVPVAGQTVAPQFRDVPTDFYVTGLQFDSASKSLLVMGREDDSVSGWVNVVPSFADGIRVFTPPTPPASPGLLFAANAAFAISGAASRFATADYTGQILVWNAGTHRAAEFPMGKIDGVERVELAPGSPLMVVRHRNSPVDIWNLATGQQMMEFTSARNGKVALASKHNWLAFFSRKQELTLFDPLTGTSTLPGLTGGRTGELRLIDEDQKVIWMDFSSQTSPTLRMWDLALKGEPRTLCHLQNSLVPLEVSQTGHVFATLCSSGEHAPPQEIIRRGVYVWTLPDLKPKLVDREGSTTALGFSPDDEFMALAAGDVEAVDLKTGDRATWEESTFSRLVTAIAFSQDGKYVYIGNNYGANNVEIWSKWRTVGRKKTLIAGVPLPVASIAPATGGDFWVGADDGTASLIRDHGRFALRLASIVNVGWVAFTPQGLFDGDADAINWIGWRKPNQSNLTPANTFFNSFYYPGLLAGVMAGTNPVPPTQTIGDLLDLPGLDYLLSTHLASLGDQDGSFGLCLPGVPTTNLLEQVDVRYKGDLQTLKTKRIKRVDLPECKYFMELPGDLRQYELNANAVQKPVVVRTDTVHRVSAAPSREVTVHVQTVTFNSYSVFGSLKFASSDGRAFRDFFAHEAYLPEERGGPHVEHWNDLEDGKTLKDIRDRLAEIGRKSKPQDIVLLFFSGHGTVLPGQQMYFFLPNSVPGKDADAIQGGSLNSAMLADAIRNITARRVLVVLDSCQSGGALDSLKKVADVKIEIEARQRVAKDEALPDSGVAIIAAATPFEQAAEQDKVGFGYLTKALLDALRSDSNDVQDLMKNLAAHISEVMQGRKMKQNPEILLSGQDFPLRTKAEFQ